MNEQSSNITRFADDLKNRLVNTKFDEELTQQLIEAQLGIEICGRVAKEIEFLLDGSISPITFKKRMLELEEGYDSKLATRP